MFRKIIFLLIFLCILLYGQQEKFSTIILVYSESDGYKWTPNEKDKNEDITKNITNLFFSSIEEKSVLEKLKDEEKEIYLPFVNSQIKGSFIQESKYSDVQAELCFPKLFYNIKFFLESMLPLRSIKMAKGKEGTIVESKTQTRITSSGTQMYWQYKVFWENILLHHGCSSISYEIETTKREIESKEISLTSSSESNSWVDISLSPQNFSFPAITLEDIDGNSLPGRMLEMQVNKKNYGLCTMSSIFEWKNIKLKDAKLSEKNFSFDFFGIGGLTLDKYPQVTPSKKASSEHFLAFRCALKPFAKLAGQQSGDDIKFKSSVVIIDYNVEGAPIPRVSLPNLIFTQKAYCWIMYPPQTSEWISINVKQERGYYYFSQVFPPRGNVYNLAIQTARSKKVYINLPIGTPDKDFVNYLKPSEEYGVPWEKVSE